MNKDNNASNIICFYHESEEYGCFSNWFKAKFEYAGKTFSSVEQYMMYHKVQMFREYDLADKIMCTDDPAAIKKLGRTHIAAFNAALWDNTCYAILKRGIRAKFMQNYDILKILLSTNNHILAEASAKDVKWGIGVAIDDADRYNIQAWRGKNLLGRILMEVRDELKSVTLKNLAYVDAHTIEFPEWEMKAGELLRIPKYHNTIRAYADTLLDSMQRDAFYYDATLHDWEVAMLVNMGGGLTAIGFWEMKQDVYEITHL